MAEFMLLAVFALPIHVSHAIENALVAACPLLLVPTLSFFSAARCGLRRLASLAGPLGRWIKDVAVLVRPASASTVIDNDGSANLICTFAKA